MQAKLVRIGNSRGVRLPKALIEEAGLPDDVRLEVRNGSIVISPASTTRSGWSEAARSLSKMGEDELFDGLVTTRFDMEDWTW